MMEQLSAYLAANAYPGRGVLLGRSADDARAVIVYFIMGRSENSRNRVFVKTHDGIRTEAFDPAKLTDPSLIIYAPVRRCGGTTIVTNGDQTDTVRDGLARGDSFARALRTRAFEPDAPNFTPRISGVLYADGGYALSILKSDNGSAAQCLRQFYEYDAPRAGHAHLIHTYRGDGAPLPSFAGEPVCVALENQSAQALAHEVWNALNAENRVALYACTVDRATGVRDEYLICKHTKEA